MKHLALREKVVAANLEIYRSKLAILNWGNASEVDRDAGVFAIKPSGVDYESLTPEMVPLIDLASGEKIEGDLNPSSDTATHWHLYKAFAEISGVVHTHSPSGTAWAQARKSIPCLGTTHADTFYGEIPCTRPLSQEEIESAYELNTGKVIVEHFTQAGLNALEVPGVLVSAHAPFTWGPSAMKAVVTAQILEEVAKMALQTFALNPDASSVEPYLLDKHYLRKHGPQATYGQK